MTDYFNQTNKNIDGGGHDKEFMIPFLASGNDAETLENTFKKLTNEKREGVKVRRNINREWYFLIKKL